MSSNHLHSIRAWRGLRLNEKYAAKLKRKAALERDKNVAREKASEAQRRYEAAAKVNPFAVWGPFHIRLQALINPLS